MEYLMEFNFIYKYLVLDTYSGHNRYITINRPCEKGEIVKGFEIIKLIDIK